MMKLLMLSFSFLSCCVCHVDCNINRFRPCSLRCIVSSIQYFGSIRSNMSNQQTNPTKYASLLVLTLQTTMAVLAMRFSRKQATGGKELYIVTTCVLISEFIKLTSCLLMLLIQKSGSVRQLMKTLAAEVIFKPWETAKLAIPSSLFTLQSNLILLALSSLDAATFQVTYQMKIITTACFSVLLLRKTIRPLQWLALVILIGGVVLAQLSSENTKTATNNQGTHSVNQQQYVIGMMAVLASAIASGFSGVYYEKLLKESSQPSVIIRNIQLGIFSIAFCLAGVFINDWDKVVQRGFFDGYTAIVWLVVLLHAVGGLAVAAVIKYADNILKGFSTSISIVLSCLVSYAVFEDLDLDLNFILGTGLVIGATFLYGIQSHTAAVSLNSLSADDKANLEIGVIRKSVYKWDWVRLNICAMQNSNNGSAHFSLKRM